jgi:hypothetical protein
LDPENHQFLEETHLSTPMTGRVYPLYIQTIIYIYYIYTISVALAFEHYIHLFATIRRVAPTYRSYS